MMKKIILTILILANICIMSSHAVTNYCKNTKDEWINVTGTGKIPSKGYQVYVSCIKEGSLLFYYDYINGHFCMMNNSHTTLDILDDDEAELLISFIMNDEEN